MVVCKSEAKQVWHLSTVSMSRNNKINCNLGYTNRYNTVLEETERRLGQRLIFSSREAGVSVIGTRTLSESHYVVFSLPSMESTPSAVD
jgi:hypothetical protein